MDRVRRRTRACSLTSNPNIHPRSLFNASKALAGILESYPAPFQLQRYLAHRLRMEGSRSLFNGAGAMRSSGLVLGNAVTTRPSPGVGFSAGESRSCAQGPDGNSSGLSAAGDHVRGVKTAPCSGLARQRSRGRGEPLLFSVLPVAANRRTPNQRGIPASPALQQRREQHPAGQMSVRRRALAQCLTHLTLAPT